MRQRGVLLGGDFTMSEPTLESLAHQAAAGDPTASDAFLSRLRAILRSLNGGMLDEVARCALALKQQGAGEVSPSAPLSPRVVPLTPELLEWARQQVNEEEVTATLRELRANGGLSSEEVLAVLDEAEGHP
jgi:hypothetical protein